jgi:hypothetical protein
VELERLAYDAALRALDKQERVLDELRARTSVLLAAAALAASFLGPDAFRDPQPVLAAAALGSFVVSMVACVFVLVPRAGRVTFSISGATLHTALYDSRDDPAELYRRITYGLSRFWLRNDERFQPLLRAFELGALALVVEILLLTALVSDTLA